MRHPPFASWRAVLPALLPAALAAPAGAAPAPALDYQLQAGDNPWRITERLLDSPRRWPLLVRLNGLDEARARRLPVGSTLRIPQAWLALRAAAVTVEAAQAGVVVQSTTGQRSPAVPGQVLGAGDTLITTETASATLRIEDGSGVLVRPGSEVVISQAARLKAGEAVQLQLQLLRGGLESLVRPVLPGGRFQIQTPSGVAAVRGTEYRVSVTPDRARAEVLDGGVWLGNGTGEVVLPAGQGSVVKTGERPAAPVPLLPAPQLADVAAKLERLPIDVPLPALAGAVAYRTQVAADAAFTQVLADAVSPAPRLRVLDVEDGVRHVRVRGIDAQGLEGRSAQRALVVHTRPEPPLLIGPAVQAQLAEPRPTVFWTVAPAGAARQVRVQVARDPAFEALEADEQVPDSGRWAVPHDLPLGRYHWRLAAVDAQRGQGPWGDPQTFDRVLAAPALQPPEPGALPMTLRWARLPGAAGYRVAVLGADAAQPPLAEHTTRDEQLTLDGLAPGRYHVRVRGQGADGQDGPWSAPQQFTVEEPPLKWPLLLLLLPFWWV